MSGHVRYSREQEKEEEDANDDYCEHNPTRPSVPRAGASAIAVAVVAITAAVVHHIVRLLLRKVARRRSKRLCRCMAQLRNNDDSYIIAERKCNDQSIDVYPGRRSAREIL